MNAMTVRSMIGFVLVLGALSPSYGFVFHPSSNGISLSPFLQKKVESILLHSTAADTNMSVNHGLDDTILSRIADSTDASKQWAEMFDLTDESGAAFHALFSGIRSSAALGLKGKPFYLKSKDILKAIGNSEGGGFDGFFTFDDLVKALEDDFLDADRGSTDNRQGWKVASVSNPRGSSFEEARMRLEDVNAALEKGTVIFNTAGSHIPKLAGATLACCDASALPCALNMYVTSAGKRTSAPPHTDRQDVIVVQTQGKKHWRVYSPPNPAANPEKDIFARGKGDDNLPLYSLEEGADGSQKLLDVTLEAGDVLFIPAAFPRKFISAIYFLKSFVSITNVTNYSSDTTDTVSDLENTPENTSIHLTFNFDTHIWDLNYLSARRLVLMRAGVVDTAMGHHTDESSKYVGNVNTLPKAVHSDLFSNLPLDFCDDMKDLPRALDEVVSELKRISKLVDDKIFEAIPSHVWNETAERLQKHGLELFDIHRDMYLAAIEEGRQRKIEDIIMNDVNANSKRMTPEKMQRLSLFRVQKYFEKITNVKKSLNQWSMENLVPSNDSESNNTLPPDWAFTLPLKVGDQVEADLGGAFFPATVTKIGTSYDVKFFDGDSMNGLSRDMIKLLAPPSSAFSSNSESTDEPPSGLTKKELKKWKKNQEKSKGKKGFK